jgi:hypothetical protein
MKKKPPSGLSPLGVDETEIAVEIPFEIVDLASALSMEPRQGVAILHSSISPPRRKVASARWLLRQLEEHKSSEGPALMFLECFVSTLRSATFALQKMGAASEGFSAWYKVKQEEMRADPQLRWLVEMRNAAEKEGLVLAEYGPRAVVRVHRDGTCETEAEDPVFKIAGYRSANLLGDLESGLAKVSEVVEEAHARFFEGYGPKHLQPALLYMREKADGSWEPLQTGDAEWGILPLAYGD